LKAGDQPITQGYQDVAGTAGRDVLLKVKFVFAVNGKKVNGS
jgi:hypothetical protein